MTGRAKRQTLHKLRLRTTLVVPFILQIITAVGLVGFIAYRSGQRAVNDVASQLRTELTHRITEKLESYTAAPRTINQLNASAFAQGDLDISNPRGEHYFWEQMQIYPTLSYVYCGDEAGSFFGASRTFDQGNSQVILHYSNASTNFIRQDFGFDQQGNRTIQVGTLDRPYDPRTRLWYEAARETQQAAWSDVYIAFATGFPTITASLPVYDSQDNTLIGACATDFFLPREVNQFLKSLQIGKTGTAFIMERSGQLVATSTEEPIVQENGEESDRLFATDSENDTIRATAEDLTRRFGDFNEIQSVQQLDYRLNGAQQYVQVVPFRDNNLDWLVVLTIPEADFMEQIHASRRNTLGLMLAALVGAIAIGLFTSRWVTRPLLRVSEASNQFAQGDLDQQVEPSPIIEVDTLAGSFNRMAGQLKASFEALRQSEATNRAIVTAIPDLMIRARGDGTYLDIVGSDRLQGVHGVQKFSPGNTVHESLPPDLANLRMHHIQQALTTGELQVYEQQISIDEQTQVEEVRILVLGEDEVLIMVRDITARKRAEEALRIAEENYRSIFENALEGIFQSSPSGEFISANPALARMYGYDSPAEMMASITNIGEQLYVDPEKRAEFRALLEQQNAVKNFEYRCYCKDGSTIWVEIDARAVKDNNGKILYYEGIVQDINDRKRREAELKKQLEELQIEIDHQKREKEVALLTNSNYFQEVQQEIAEVNLDEFWS
ncbi:PAS domain S-box protein [Egbenema bharatensis]|uniref:PAS domain S-box protein n=1 Tax=Egbenema bharatensis TaxID=3463334 RepID=UPI003A84DE61